MTIFAYSNQNMKTKLAVTLLFLCAIPAFSQNRLSPEVDRSSAEYYKQIDNLLLGEEGSRFILQVRPSFDPECCLYFSDKARELVLRESERNIWYAKGQGGTVKEYHCPVPISVVEKLDSLFMVAVFSSSFMCSSYIHDGTTYELRTFGGRFAASCRPSRNDDSNCGRLVFVFSRLCELVKVGNDEGVKGLLPEIDTLTDTFYELLPDGESIMNPETGFVFEKYDGARE